METSTKQFEGHTPGPWKLTREGTSMPEDKDSPTLIVVDTKTNHAISEVRWTRDRYSHAPMLKAARANAALIASAPELLKERDKLKTEAEHHIKVRTQLFEEMSELERMILNFNLGAMTLAQDLKNGRLHTPDVETFVGQVLGTIAGVKAMAEKRS